MPQAIVQLPVRRVTMSTLNKHAGYLDPAFQRGIPIHADWPIYPEEEGAGLALAGFTSFPPGTVFKRIDDIDRCVLFFADVKHPQHNDPFNEKNFHVAVWHEDLLQLQEDGFIEGVTPVSGRRWEEIKRSEILDEIWERMKRSSPGEEIKRSELQGVKLGYRLPDGTFKEAELSEMLQEIDDYDD